MVCVHLLTQTFAELFELRHNVFLLCLKCFNSRLLRLIFLLYFGELELVVEALGLQVLPDSTLLLFLFCLLLDPFLESLLVVRDALTDSAQLIHLTFHLLESHRLERGVLLALL